MKRSFFAIAALFVCLSSNAARAQSPSQAKTQADDPPRYEVGVQFSALTLTPSSGYRTEIGFGGRITLNLNPHVALEAETNFFPNSGRSAEPRATGRAFEGLFGVKAGRRWQKFGVFAKARPGFISFSDGAAHYIVDGSNIDFRADRATHFATDVGGVLEFYVSRRLMTRFDVGDTIIRYGAQTTANPFPPPLNFTIPDATRHNLQVTAGIGFRF
jgi:Outer membrane protein beta-barrel domain